MYGIELALIFSFFIILGYLNRRMATRSSRSSARTMNRLALPHEEPRVDKPVEVIINDVPETPLELTKTRKGSRYKVTTKRLGDYIDEIPTSALRARLPIKKKVVKKPETDKVGITKKTKAVRKIGLAQKAINKKHLIVEREKSKSTKELTPIAAKGYDDSGLDKSDKSDDYYGRNVAVEASFRRLMLKYPYDIYPRAQGGLTDGSVVGRNDDLENQSPNVMKNKSPLMMIENITLPHVIGNMKTTGLEDHESFTVTKEKATKSNRHSTQSSTLTRANAKKSNGQQKRDYDKEDNRSKGHSVSSKGTKSQTRIATPREQQDTGGGGDDGSSSSSDDSDTSTSSDKHRGGLSTTGSTIKSDDEGFDAQSLVTEDGSRYRNLFKDDPNAKTDSMNIPHWILWVAGIRRVDFRYVIIDALGLHFLAAFTFVKEDAVVRTSKSIRKTYKISLSEVETAMIWTSIRIIQMALLNKKTINDGSIRKLVTSEEL